MADLSSYINIAANTASATGNITGNYFIGNGSQLTGIVPGAISNIANGNSNVTIATSAGSVNTNVSGALAMSVTSTGVQIAGTGRLLSPGGAAAVTLNNNGANIPTANITTALNVTGNASVTGNITATGVATNMVRRANTISGANTVVTLDNLTASLGGTPTRLFIGAATSNMTMAGTSQTMTSGSMAVSSWINVPIVTGAGNGFAMSGAVSTNGDTAVLNITDQGAGSGSWRITGIIANTSANLYSVSIERLA